MRKYKSTMECKVECSHQAWRMPVERDYLIARPGHTLLVTMNGYQWSGLSTMTMDELEVLGAFITDYVRENRE